MVPRFPIHVPSSGVIGLTAVGAFILSSTVVMVAQSSSAQFQLPTQEQQQPPPAPSAPLQPQQQSSNANPDVTIWSHRLIEEFIGASVVGEVHNNSPDVISFPKISGKFYDSSGQLIHLADAFIWPSDLRPGETAPFRIFISDDSIADNVANYTLSSEASTLPGQNKPAMLKVGIAKQGTVDRIGPAIYQIIGNVTNTGDVPATFVFVTAAFFNSLGRIVDFETTDTTPETIPPGQSADFIIETTVGDFGNETAEAKSIAYTNVRVTSNEYLSTMEPS